jgi:hypothetical protein
MRTRRRSATLPEIGNDTADEEEEDEPEEMTLLVLCNVCPISTPEEGAHSTCWPNGLMIVIVIIVSHIMNRILIVLCRSCSLKSNNVKASEQGNIQGAIVGIQSLAMGIGPLAFSGLFAFLTR